MIICGEVCRDWIKVSLSGLALLSIILAYFSLRSTKQKFESDKIRDQDKEYLVQVERSFEWAYSTLTDDGTATPPRADRLNWLASARYILRAQGIASKIVTPVYKLVLEQVEDHWRQRFYLALDDPSLLSSTYFAGGLNSAWPENIEISSALVVVNFSNWKTGVQDPTDTVDRKALMEDAGGLQSHAGRGLCDYIDKLYSIKRMRGVSEMSGNRRY